MTDSVPRIAVVSALQEEISALTDRVATDREETVGGQKVTLGTLGSVPVALASTGTGRERARRGVAALLDHQPVDALLYVGVAGALDPSLEVDALLLPKTVQDEGGQAVHPPDARWRKRVETALSEAFIGTLVTVDQVVTRPEEKDALWAALDQTAPAAIDMETRAVAPVAEERNVPYLSLRVISDQADEHLPDLLKDAQRDDGSLDRTQVMQKAVWSPSAVPTLMRMRERVQGASEVLAEAVTQVVHRARDPETR